MSAATMTPFTFSTALKQQPAVSPPILSLMGAFGVSADEQQLFVAVRLPPQQASEQHFSGIAVSPLQQALAIPLAVPSSLVDV